MYEILRRFGIKENLPNMYVGLFYTVNPMKYQESSSLQLQISETFNFLFHCNRHKKVNYLLSLTVTDFFTDIGWFFVMKLIIYFLVFVVVAEDLLSKIYFWHLEQFERKKSLIFQNQIQVNSLNEFWIWILSSNTWVEWFLTLSRSV